jgi:hypothetical protein
MRRIGILSALLVLVLTLVACAQTSVVDEKKAACFANETLIKTEMQLFKADSGLDAPLQDVIDKLHVKCPSGGTYSYDATTGVVTCSVHGHP